MKIKQQGKKRFFRALGAVGGFNFALTFAVALEFAFSIATSRAALTSVTTAPGFGPWQIGSGGEFTMIVNADGAAQLSSYSPSTKNQGGYPGSFQTFCMERDEGIAPNTTYDVTFNNITVFTGDPLSAGAAYLYQQFATGQLDYNYASAPNYKGFPTSDSRTSGFLFSAYYLQHALWYLMNPNMYSGQEQNPYVIIADIALGSEAATFAPDNGAHGVSVLNLWAPGQPHDPANRFQDVLFYNGDPLITHHSVSSVPEASTIAAGTILLLPLGASFVLNRRKKSVC